MRKNIFIKSMLRQPLRTALLVALIGLASFAFVLRTVEFIVVRRQIYATAAYYRTIGQIHHAALFGDITEGIERLINAPEMGLVDYRRAVEGIMPDLLNADFSGMHHRMIQMWTGRLTQPRLNEAFFYAYVLGIQSGGRGGVHTLDVRVCTVLSGHPEYIIPGQRINLQKRSGGMNYPGALDIMMGSLRHVDFPPMDEEKYFEGFIRITEPLVHNPVHSGTLLRASFGMIDRLWLFNPTTGQMELQHELLPPGVLRLHGYFLYVGEDFVPPAGWLIHNGTFLYEGSLGQRFLFRGIYTRVYPAGGGGMFTLNPAHGPLAPIVYDSSMTDSHNDLHLWPLCWAGERIHEQIWYWPAPTGTEVDFTLPALMHVPVAIQQVNRDLRSMQLQTTRNMETMPEMGQVFELMDGRLINYDDYINNRRVAVIDQGFAQARGVELGDTLTFHVPFEQHLSDGLRLPGITLPLVRVEREHIHRYENGYELTVEVVGITRFSAFSRMSERSLLVFIPDSVLPDGIGILWRQFGWDGETAPLLMGVDYHPDVWFSFTLADARDEDAFSEAYRYIFELSEEMDLIIHYAEAGTFWASAGPILLSITFNAALFWLVLALVLGLVAFLFIRQRRRDFAIIRTLGISAKRVYLLLILAVMLFSIPAVAVGSYFGWQMALGEAEYTLLAFEDVYDEALPLTPFEVQWLNFFSEMPPRGVIDGRREVDLTVTLENEMLLLLMGIVFTGLMLFILSGGFTTLRLPVLAQLQGGLGRRQKRSKPSKKDTPALNPAIQPHRSIGVTEVKNTKITNALRSVFRYITRHTFRAPMKSGLGVLIAVFFVIFLGWLHHSILQTEAEIEHIYDTWVVPADIIPVDDIAFYTDVDAFFNASIRRSAVERIRATGYVYTEYVEIPFERSVIMATDEYGGVPVDWRIRTRIPRLIVQFWGIHGIAPHNRTFAISCLEEFEVRNSLSAGILRVWEQYQEDEELLDAVAERSVGGISFTFYEGFDHQAFNGPTPSGHIPVVVSARVLYERGLALGDIAAYGFSSWGNDWDFEFVQVVGIHNQNIHAPHLRDATLLPAWAAEERFIGFFYRTAEFGIHPGHNRDLNHIRFAWEYILNPIHLPPLLELTIHDGELRTVTGALGQILMLLELMFPVVVALAVLIGFGLSILLMLQNAVNAAIIRMLGASGHKARFILWLEQFILCTVGLVLGLGVLFILGMGLTTVVVLAGLYLAGYALGALVGAVMITRKPPLDLLQVRE